MSPTNLAETIKKITGVVGSYYHIFDDKTQIVGRAVNEGYRVSCPSSNNSLYSTIYA